MQNRLSRLLRKMPASISQFNELAVAFKELEAKLVLQIENSLAEGRLVNPQTFGRH